jgi:endo-1,4-beta-xylanase
MHSCFRRIGIVAVFVLGTGCSKNASSPAGATGGASSSGGLTGSGGATSSGGTTGSGGATTATGTSSTGGTTSTGGSTGNGGATLQGGSPGTGGSRATGGTPGTGGSRATGGTPGTGGFSSAGGSAGSDAGTLTATGGKASGGSTATGGMPASGGTTAADAALGGATGTGGSRATGGAGGVSATGGSKATGGTTGAGGATSCGTQPTLKQAAACTGRLIGVALSTAHLSESAYVTAAKDFNYVTPENEMKWSNIEPTRNKFSFGGADQIVSFASSNGMKVKGHALVWHNQLPSWASSLGNATDVRAAMLAHIKGVVQYYKGKVQAWDVVNEAVSLDGTGMRDSVFYRYLGETFIDEAFQAARDADPDAKLYYNDYNCEGLALKANTVFDLVKRMKSRGVAFDGVGLQMHYGTPNQAVPTADFVANLQRYADLGLDLLISEMDVHVCAGLTPTQQQTVYHDLIAACVAQPRCIAATFWGIADKYSWLNAEPDLGCSGGQQPLGLLWDDNFKKKPAYSGVMDALAGR